MPGTVPAYHSVDYQFTSQLDLAFAVTNRPKFHNCPFISHLASTNAAVNIRSRNTPIFQWNFLQDLCRNLTWKKKQRAWSKGALKIHCSATSCSFHSATLYDHQQMSICSEHKHMYSDILYITAAENASQIKLGAGLMRKAKPNQTPRPARCIGSRTTTRLPKEATCATVAEGVAFFIRQAIRY